LLYNGAWPQAQRIGRLRMFNVNKAGQFSEFTGSAIFAARLCPSYVLSVCPEEDGRFLNQYEIIW